jgi:hypothetical protein
MVTVTSLEDNYMMPFFRWVPSVKRGGEVIMERMPALLLVRPRSSILPRSPLAAILDQQLPPKYAGATPRLGH